MLTFENKRACLCLQLRFPDPSTSGNFQIWEGEKGGRQANQLTLVLGRSHCKGPNPKALSPPGGHEERPFVRLECAGDSGLALKGGGDRHRVFWAARSLTASGRHGWDRRWQQRTRLCGPSVLLDQAASPNNLAFNGRPGKAALGPRLSCGSGRSFKTNPKQSEFCEHSLFSPEEHPAAGT